MNVTYRFRWQTWFSVFSWLLFLSVLLLTTYVRVRLLGVVLNRDEGEYAYQGQLILQGIPPYQFAFNMKLPGVYYAYALMMAVFGESIHGIRLGCLVFNLLTILGVFLVAKRLWGEIAGIFAGIAYALLSLPWLYGLQAHATHFVVFFMMAATGLLLKAREKENRWFLFAAGICYGFSFLMKQHGLFFILFGAFVILWDHDRKNKTQKLSAFFKNIGVYLLGAGLPYGIVCLILVKQGVFGNFWFWTVDYARAYATETPLAVGVINFIDQWKSVTRFFWILWYSVFAGILMLWIDREKRKDIGFVMGFAFFSFLTICPRLLFREHYFIALLPAVAIFNGIFIGSIYQFAGNRKMPVVLFLIILTLFVGSVSWDVFKQRYWLFEMAPQKVSREISSNNPWVESIPIADYLKAHSTPQDRIFVLGSEPQIYFYSERRAAIGHIYMYSMMETEAYAFRMRDQILKNVAVVRPKFIVFVDSDYSWLWDPDLKLRVMNWLRDFTRKDYKLVGVVNMISSERTDYYWDDRVKNVPLSPAGSLMIYQLRET